MTKKLKKLLLDFKEIKEKQKENNDELNRINKLSKKINSILLKTFGVGTALLLIPLLYFIPILPKATPAAIVMGSAFAGGALTYISGSLLVASNLLYFIPAKALLKHFNKKLANERIKVNNEIKKESENENIEEKKQTTKPNKSKYSYNPTNNNKSNKKPEKTKTSLVNKEKSKKITPAKKKIVIINGRPCYVNEKTDAKTRKKTIS